MSGSSFNENLGDNSQKAVNTFSLKITSNLTSFAAVHALIG
jgi:hypothetical protein